MVLRGLTTSLEGIWSPRALQKFTRTQKTCKENHPTRHPKRFFKSQKTPPVASLGNRSPRNKVNESESEEDEVWELGSGEK